MISLFRKNKKAVPVIAMVEPSPDDRVETVGKRTQPKKLSFESGLRPYYYLSRVFGLMPFTIIHDANGEVQESRVNKRDVSWLAMSIFVHSSIGFITFRDMNIELEPKTSKYILAVGYNAMFAVIVALSICGMGMDMCNRFRLVGILKKFTKFDAEASQKFIRNAVSIVLILHFLLQMLAFGVQFHYEKERRRSWLLCAVFVMVGSILMTIAAFSFFVYKSENFIFTLVKILAPRILCMFALNLPIILSTVLLRSLHERFVALNNILRFELFIDTQNCKIFRLLFFVLCCMGTGVDS